MLACQHGRLGDFFLVLVNLGVFFCSASGWFFLRFLVCWGLGDLVCWGLGDLVRMVFGVLVWGEVAGTVFLLRMVPQILLAREV